MDGWTLPTAIFFIVIASMLVAMTIWQILSPSIPRRGFLPIETTRGDRLFIRPSRQRYIHIAWIALTSLSLWTALAIALVWLVVVMRWG